MTQAINLHVEIPEADRTDKLVPLFKSDDTLGPLRRGINRNVAANLIYTAGLELMERRFGGEDAKEDK